MRCNRLLAMATMAAAGLSVVTPAQAADVELGLNLDTDAKTWEATAQVTNDDETTQGISGITFDVTGGPAPSDPGGAGLTVSSVSNELPTVTAIDADDFSNTITKGYNQFRNAPSDGQGIRGAHSVQLEENAELGNNIFEDFALAPINEDNGLADPTVTGVPAVIATGEYTGEFGTLTVSSDIASVSLLPEPLTSGPNDISIATADPDSVSGQTVVVAIPEPATLSLLGLGGLAMLGSRRRKS